MNFTRQDKRRSVRRSTLAAYDRTASAPPNVVYAWRRYLETKCTSPSPPKGCIRICLNALGKPSYREPL